MCRAEVTPARPPNPEPYTRTRAAPEAGTLESDDTLELDDRGCGMSADQDSVSVPMSRATVSLSVNERPMLAATFIARLESDVHAVSSVAVSPACAWAVMLYCPKSAPSTNRCASPPSSFAVGRFPV